MHEMSALAAEAPTYIRKRQHQSGPGVQFASVDGPHLELTLNYRDRPHQRERSRIGSASAARHANLAASWMPRAHLERCELADADLRHANLRGACVTGAELHGAYLQGEDPHGADLTRHAS